MKRTQKGSPFFWFVLLVSGVAAGWLVVHQAGPKSGGPESALSGLNPFRVRTTEAQAFSGITLTPASPSTPNYDQILCFGAAAGSGYPNTDAFCLRPSDATAPPWRQIVQPYVLITFNVPTDDTYVIAIQATGTQATLKSCIPPYPTVQTWDHSDNPNGTFTYSMVIQLDAGYHDFMWAVSQPAYVYSVSLLPFQP